MKIRVGLAVAAVVAVYGCAARDPCEDRSFNRDAAIFATEGAVKARLRAPASARFPTNSQGQGAHVRKIGECRFRVSSHVDSQNAFGAMLRSNYLADVVVSPDGTRRVENLSISEQ